MDLMEEADDAPTARRIALVLGERPMWWSPEKDTGTKKMQKGQTRPTFQLWGAGCVVERKCDYRGAPLYPKSARTFQRHGVGGIFFNIIARIISGGRGVVVRPGRGGSFVRACAPVVIMGAR
jgi:hypothetical protein